MPEVARMVHIEGEPRPPLEDRTYKLLVVCSPNSGSRYLAACLRGSNLEVNHQALGRHGTVSPYLAVDSTEKECGIKVPGHPLAKHAFDWVVHLVRHPLDTINSLAHAGVGRSWWPYQQLFTGVKFPETDPVEKVWRAGEFWVSWNELIADNRKPNLLIQIEQLREKWPVLMSLVHHERGFPTHINRIPTQTVRTPLAWSDLGPYEEDVRKLAQLYGYGTDG